MLKLITTDSYFNLFALLNIELKGKVNCMDGKNLIFCEEKISLMAERSILSEFGGSFNTAVYSFGNYLRAKKPNLLALTKEGSAMAVKRILSYVPLNSFRASKVGLAPSLYELIIQLKSAKVTPNDILMAKQSTSGALKNKLSDIYEVYAEYENFVEQSGIDDQSSMLSYLPELFENDNEIKHSDVYIVGFNGWTSQIRSAISTLVKCANSVTAILVEGDNELVYVNETANNFRDIASAFSKSLKQVKIKSSWNNEGEIIARSLFNPTIVSKEKFKTDKIFALSAENRSQEVDRVAEVIRQKILNGECRYKDITLAIPDIGAYSDDIERAFKAMGIPYFLDQKRKVDVHPLVKLIITYIDATRKNLAKTELSAFYKNPLFIEDKSISDEFENYVLAYNIDYLRIKKPFTFAPNGRLTLDELNSIRQDIVDCFEVFNIKKLLINLNVQEKLSELSEKLKSIGEIEESAVNEQVFSSVIKLLDEMDGMLKGVEMSLVEYKNVFVSGISAMELAIIPQYNDAVFVGGFKETALAKAKYLFVLGLTSEVPAVRDDVALLSDGDINLLEQIKVLVEPKIKVVNHRVRENLALALSAFDKGLYVSYPLISVSGDKNSKSQVYSAIQDMFTTLSFPKRNGYISLKSGLSVFARSCGDFATGRLNDFTDASSYYSAVGGEELNGLLDRSNKEVKIRLSGSREIMQHEYISPTSIEDYYKCPYRAFLSSGLKLERREEGVVDGFSVGNLMHDIFNLYAKKINQVSDRESSDRLVNELAKNELQKEKYARFMLDTVTEISVQSAISECAKFCYKNYLSLKTSKFYIKKTEAKFTDKEDGVYPAIKLLNGDVKLIGKIDRVDECGDYYRILDYKTVSPSADLDLLFTGKKLQLYLYAKAVDFDKEHPKKLAGVYYMPVQDKYIKDGEKEPCISKGLTLDDGEVISLFDTNLASTGESLFLNAQIKDEQLKIEGQTSEQGLKSCVDYAIKLSEKAVERMREGVVAPTPCDERICSYCDFKAMCPYLDVEVRSHSAVDENVIIDAVKGEKECQN